MWLLPALLFAMLPLSTAAQETSLALVLAATLFARARRHIRDAPFVPEAALLSVVWVLSAAQSGQLREGLGHAWLLAPLVALVGWPRDPRVPRVGLAAACVAALWGLTQLVTGAPVRAGFSHHLSLAYALVPPFAYAVATRAWLPATLLAAGALATGSSAVPIALLTAAVATRRPFPAVAIGAAGTIVLLVVGADALGAELEQRAILWSGGLSLAELGGVGAGAYADTSAARYDLLEPGFWFPNHAHDAQLQLLAVLGPAGLLAHLALLFAILRRGGPGAAGLAGVVVGSLSQDVFGDLEVARAAWIWAAWTVVGNRHGTSEV